MVECLKDNNDIDAVIPANDMLAEGVVKALEEAGGKLENVIRTRVYLTDNSRWEEAGKAHGDNFPTGGSEEEI